MLPNSVNSYLHSWGEYLVPVLKDSKFRETGVITPQEFLKAGDYLVFKSPYWHWESGDLEKRKDYLERDKQFLVTRNVACLKRVKGESEEIVREDDKDMEDDYMNIIISNALREDKDEEERMEEYDEIPEIQTGNESHEVEVKKDEEEEEEEEEEVKDEEIPDIDDFSGLNIKEETDHVVSTSNNNNNNNNNNGDTPSSNILTDNVRTYDLFITYDKYYQCPRLWLFGYDSNRKRPLSIEEVFEDVSEDHAKKTITLEPFPHYSASTTNTEMLTVHPCRHANVMKRIIDRMVESSSSSSSSSSDADHDSATATATATAEVEACLIVFLKFMSCIVPTIEYDHTNTPSSNILTDNVRTYDLFITYDKYYQCPRLWLFGYDSNRKRPLSIEEVFEDVSEDHAKKTITLEPFPHYSASTTNTEMLTVHPCRHANVMKRIIDRMVESSSSSSSSSSDADHDSATATATATAEVEACLIVFLKFMSCIVPTIEYDHTSGVKAAGLKK
ncbi:hypothetical protein MP638_000421 [Amoeboaphelidium occidentale]|nr:hypothetical protein MP638_000421 [Amoeboaphelidium occidentale]